MTSTAMPLTAVATTFFRARCRQPARVEKMKQSLAAHGQLTALIAVPGPERPELIDGFKRHAAATQMGLTTLVVSVRPLDETAKWAAMLLLNQCSKSMTPLEEALVLQELLSAGLTQLQIGTMLERHKTWVSRRLGLVERLHPDLIEQMRLGILPPGVARRLLSLPRGNQLEVAAAALTARLGPRDTELLVSLWHRAKDPTARRAVLMDPQASLLAERPETRRMPVDPTLSRSGQRLSRLLWTLAETTSRTCSMAKTPPPSTDLVRLKTALDRASDAASRLVTALGSLASGASGDTKDASGVTS